MTAATRQPTLSEATAAFPIVRTLAGALLAALLGCGGIAVVDGAGAGGAGGTTDVGSGAGGPSSTSSGGQGCDGCSFNDGYCAYPDKLCGIGQAGTCKPKPGGSCPAVYDPVCGCDGVVYGNLCEAQNLGQDESSIENCSPPDGTFACGSKFCFMGGDYCQIMISDVVGVPDEYTCLPLPGGCFDGPSPSCGCLAGVPCGNICDEPLDDILKVTCPGG